MSRRDVALAALVAACWGVNFVAIHASLQHYPPLFLVALRFAVLAVPALLFVPRPDVPLRWLLGYGLGFGVLQFAFLYLGMAAGMPAGIASLVLQASAPFTVLLATLWLNERPGRPAMFGVGLALLGLIVIGVNRGLTASLLPMLLVVAGALGWAFGNLCTRQAQASSPMRLMWWMTVVPPLPMLALSLVVEGPERIGDALASAPTAWGANLGLAYTVLIATVVGSGLWSTLMARNPSSSVAPFSMLVPVVGILSAWVALGERPTLWELIGGLLVVGGVGWPHLRHRLRRASAPPRRRSAR